MATVAGAGRSAGAPPAGISRNGRRLAMGLLLLTYISSYLDRSIVNILIEPIREDLGLADWQLGFLSGTAFAIFYATLGIPVARLADRGNRKAIIVASLTIWSGMTAVCGLAGNFVQLALARVGVGVGEAGSSPPSHSIIADLYPREERGRAMSIYSLGVYIGGGLGTIMGGLVAAEYGWRAAFFIAGLPGLLLALLVWLFLKDPARGASEGGRAVPAAAEQAPVGEAFRTLWASKASRWLITGVTLTSFVGYGKGAFGPSFLIRSYGLDLVTVSAMVAPIVTLLGAAGVLLGGWAADRLGRRDLRWTAWVVAAGKLAAFPCWMAFYLSESLWIGIPAYMAANLLSALYLGPTFAMIQSLTPLRLRAMAAAVMLFVLNLIGLGLGPLLIGGVSDLLRPAFGEESLRWTLVGASVMTFLAALPYYWGGKHYARELAAAEGR